MNIKTKLPYGLSDFKRVKTEDWYYIDKTKFIQTIEDEQSFLFFLRPRRFGKSLTIAMLEAYYDIYYKEEFDAIFKDTYIIENQTPLKSSFYLLKFDFSAVDITNYASSFKNHINSKINSFIIKYKIDTIEISENPLERLELLFEYCRIKRLPIYILIDEYDNFANKLLISNINSYKNIVTDKEAFYKEFFTMLKAGTSGNDGAIKKMFFTGVSPLALYDVTSGSNIGKNISLDESFNDMVGITKSELIEMIKVYKLEDKQKEIISRCDEWYNSYKFNQDIEHTVYNSDMILYYLDSLIRKDREPNDLIDVNVRTDYSKLKFLVYTDKKLNGNFEILNNLITGKKITTTKIKDNFSAFELSNEDNFKSFIFSLGFVTLEKELFRLNLKIPNQTLKKLLSEFIHYAYQDFEDYNMKVENLNVLLSELAIKKDLEVFKYIGEVIKESSSIRDYIDGENFVKAYLLAYLNLNTFYEVKSEVEMNKGYIDILLEPIQAEVPFGVIIELKYIKRTQIEYEKTVEELVNQAKKQLQQYDMGRRYMKVVLVFRGWELVYCGEVL
ncbi:MAG: AAA family ATPase [Campylobacterota bacterium]|nr:AAA family ATPase [Campylobacterota bacterium]